MKVIHLFILLPICVEMAYLNTAQASDLSNKKKAYIKIQEESTERGAHSHFVTITAPLFHRGQRWLPEERGLSSVLLYKMNEA
jgi:hypothetical protein